MSRVLFCLTLVMALALLGGAARADTDPVVARQGERTLTASAVRDMIAALEPEQQLALRADPQALASFVRDRLLQADLLDQARASQWDQKPDIAARATQARDTVITDSYLASLSQPDPGFPSDQDIQTAYEANKAKLMLPRQYHLAQIFIAAPAGEADAQARLAALRQAWLKAKGDPAAVVRKSGDDRSPRAVAADLGWVREDRIAPALRATVAGMTEGALSEPIRIADGWHVLRMIETRPAAPATLADSRDTLVQALRQAKARQNARATIDGLLQRTPIQLNEIELAHLTGK